ncbi:porin family protein [Vibrio genomosp. F6]|uniref:outer membrane beta-barrel protein n=1 Tax=Vibrio TaxID=662 RepID=UPI0010BDBFEE|nr:outer membrane beta-barrel protein [Vibrio genomosp. F6]TKF13321.1 porin family protein [Vibrio genomosp. F6]
MKKLMTLLTLTVLTSGTAIAASNTSNFYVGIDYVKSDFIDIPLFTKSDESSGYALQFGYQLPTLSDWVNAFELEYINAGSAKYNYDNLGGAITGSGELKLTAINLSYKPRLYFGRFYVSGQVGYASVSASGNANYTVSGTRTDVDLVEKIGSGVTLGGEVGLMVTKNISLKGGYKLIEANTSTLYTGLAFNF